MAVSRSREYLADETGAHLSHNPESLARALEKLSMGVQRAPMDASPATAPMRDLEGAGMSRLSVGPWMLKAALTKMKEVAETLKDYGSYDVFADGTMTTDEVRRYLRGGEMV